MGAEALAVQDEVLKALGETLGLVLVRAARHAEELAHRLAHRPQVTRRPRRGPSRPQPLGPPPRGTGYGTVQLKHITELLRCLGFTRALARTGDIDFFTPARKMYEACGFVAVATDPPGPAAPFSLIEYELIL
jgi:GNAT superfamily N-acetyltransferase